MLHVVANIITHIINKTVMLFFFLVLNRSRVGGRDRKKSPGAKQRTGSNAEIITSVS